MRRPGGRLTRSLFKTLRPEELDFFENAISPTWLWYLPVPLDAVSDVSKRGRNEANGSILVFWFSFLLAFLLGLFGSLNPVLVLCSACLPRDLASSYLLAVWKNLSEQI